MSQSLKHEITQHDKDRFNEILATYRSNNRNKLPALAEEISQEHQTLEICDYACQMNPHNIFFIRPIFLSRDLVIRVLGVLESLLHTKLFKYVVPELNDDLITTQKFWDDIFNSSQTICLKYVPLKFRSKQMSEVAAFNRPELRNSLQYIPSKWKTHEICLAEIKKKCSMAKYIPKKLFNNEIAEAILSANEDAVMTFIPKEHQTIELCHFYFENAKHSIHLSDIHNELYEDNLELCAKYVKYAFARQNTRYSYYYRTCDLILNPIPEKFVEHYEFVALVLHLIPEGCKKSLWNYYVKNHRRVVKDYSNWHDFVDYYYVDPSSNIKGQYSRQINKSYNYNKSLMV